MFEYKHNAKIEARERVVKVNPYFSTGEIGERIDTQTGLVDKENGKDKRKVRGTFFTNLVVQKKRREARS